AISAEYPELRSCIITEQIHYLWNRNIPYEADVFLFENRCMSLLNLECPADWRESYAEALDLYKGNLDAPFSTDEWIKGRGMYYQELYLKLVYRYVSYLKEEKEYETIINICRAALNIEAFDENLNLELMYALKEINQNNAALLHYRHSTDMYYKYLGMEPSNKMLEFYRHLIKADLGVQENLAIVREKLVEDKLGNQAFLCDYSIFKDIYQLQLRNVERWGVQMFLAMVVVENTNQNEEFEPFILDQIMRSLLDILMGSLRRGDIVTRYSASQYAILLQMTSLRDGDIVIDRVRKVFCETNQNPYAKIIFQVEHISPK
ncbi:MAG: hypothetical protein LBU99_04400, partial [Spirochaetaceae bacterium]|nr:hypothetical protein [Spirochaetaceae bacterium]